VCAHRCPANSSTQSLLCLAQLSLASFRPSALPTPPVLTRRYNTSLLHLRRAPLLLRLDEPCTTRQSLNRDYSAPHAFPRHFLASASSYIRGLARIHPKGQTSESSQIHRQRIIDRSSYSQLQHRPFLPPCPLAPFALHLSKGTITTTHHIAVAVSSEALKGSPRLTPSQSSQRTPTRYLAGPELPNVTVDLLATHRNQVSLQSCRIATDPLHRRLPCRLKQRLSDLVRINPPQRLPFPIHLYSFGLCHCQKTRLDMSAQAFWRE